MAPGVGRWGGCDVLVGAGKCGAGYATSLRLYVPSRRGRKLKGKGVCVSMPTSLLMVGRCVALTVFC